MVSTTYELVTLLLGILGALSGFLLLYKLPISMFRSWRRRRAFLGNVSGRYVAIGSTPDGKTVRTSDNEALAVMREAFRAGAVPGTCQTANALKPSSIHSSPLLVIGSPRYNAVADDLQRRIAMPFEFVSLTPELPPASSVLCIYECTGQEYVCSADPSLGEIEQARRPPSISGQEEDYGILLVGRLEDSETNDQQVIWAAGIHGIGTLGVVKWALENLSKYDWNELGNTCFLIRVRFQLRKGDPLLPNSPDENLSNAQPELIRGPCPWQPRSTFASSQSPVGVLCDLGSVLLPFHRHRFEHNLRHLLGIELLSRKQRGEIEKLQEAFEKGTRDVSQFVVELQGILGCADTDAAAIKLAWKDIFWRNEREILLLSRYRSRDIIRLVLISNTDPLRLEHALRRLELEKLFDSEHVVASFHRGVGPKGIDNSMLSKGLSILERDLPTKTFTAVFIDDVRDYLVMAKGHGFGIEHMHFRTFAQFVYELRRYGLYDSMADWSP
jgi:hypothetical protein